MISRKNVSFLGLLFLLTAGSILAQDPVAERRIDSLLRQMTIEEKCGQLNQISASWKNDRPYLTDAEQSMVRDGLLGSMLNAFGADAVREIQNFAVTKSRLRIPLILGLDVVHGFRTIFPVPLAEASTWDPELVGRTARVAAEEAAAAGIHWTFAPMVDIARDPRWGRIVEGSGEDPYLGSLMSAARVRGFQGKNLADPASILACAKHFAAYGGAEAGRDYNTVDVSERTMRDVYLPPFRAAVDAGAGSLMSSFNEIGGVPASANHWLMTDLLRTEWRFTGFVVSDWTAIEELINHGVAANRAGAGALALNAGVDMDMVSQIYAKELPALVRGGQVKEAILDEAVRRVLRMKFTLGLFDDPFRGISEERERRTELTPEHRALALEAAHKSIVLLKNEGQILPLRKSIKSVAVIGPLADSRKDPLGPWHGAGKADDVVSLLDGIRKKLPAGTRLLHAQGCGIEDPGDGLADAVAAARKAEVAILVLGEGEEMSGEASSRANIDLPAAQHDLLVHIVETGTPVVLVLMNGRPLTISREAESVPAILETWFLGVETGNAIADVLFGDVNPSGKLPVTFPRSTGQIPLYYNHKNTGRPYKDGDKYTSRYLDLPNTPLYPFGFGLSYTTFEYSDLTLGSSAIQESDSLRLSVVVKNSGLRSGDEVVQLYLRDDVASVTRPVRELKKFRRITLGTGESARVEFVLHPEDLMLTNLEMKRVLEPGTFSVYIGPNSVDCLESKFEVR
jgi:beta-glucosidase